MKLLKDPSLSEYKQDNPPSNKRQKLDLPKKQVPKSLNEYEPYENVLPSAKIINDYKVTLAIQIEKETATALYNMPDDVKSTLHFDSTQRSKIDGDWPCLILIFTNNLRFSLRPLFFAYEDGENIVRLIVETYIRLALTITSTDQAVSAKDLWGKTTAVMTDSVRKNLKIEDGVADVLKSNYKPYHLFCKSHLVEAFVRSNIEVLSTIENQLNFREKLESINPSVRSFLCGVAVCGIKSTLNLISHIKQPLPLTWLIYLILFYNVRIKSNIHLFIKNVDLQNLVTLLLLYFMLYLAYVCC